MGAIPVIDPPVMVTALLFCGANVPSPGPRAETTKAVVAIWVLAVPGDPGPDHSLIKRCPRITVVVSPLGCLVVNSRTTEARRHTGVLNSRNKMHPVRISIDWIQTGCQDSPIGMLEPNCYG